MVETYLNSSRQAKRLQDNDTIMIGATAMIGFSTKILEEITREKSLRKKTSFGGLFVMNKNRTRTSSTGTLFTDDDTLCSNDHEENVRRVVYDEDSFRKMQETLRESKFSTNQGIKHAMVEYFR